ncbi:hypothetical protein KM043_003248 [Ampulex compressa]|nr:hypothetical protein KM043_003248 [Ampulex compressa]
MDSQVCGDGRLLDLIDEAWRKERLPIDEISVPLAELPDPESDNGDSHMTLKELEQKWNNLALGTLSENHLHSPTPYHGCLEISNDEKARKLKKWQIPKQQFAEAKAAADQEVSDNLKRSKNTAMANKVRLMRVKGSASGPKKVPMNERCYFLVYPPLAVTNKFIKPSKAVYISSNWTVGKIIDSIADTLKIINNNNNPNECKLRLFHFVTGAVICNDMGTPVKQLFDDNELVDGQSVILEYSDNTSVDSSLYK